MTELFDAANADNLERVKLLVEQGVDKNQVGGKFNDTALATAALQGHFDIVQYLVEQGADIDKGNWSPLILATRNDHFEVATSWSKERTGTRPISSAGLPFTMLLRTVISRSQNCS